ncbi:hypothetical protein ACVW1A_006951 [Bradyrhizobium sp. LB1.3]
MPLKLGSQLMFPVVKITRQFMLGKPIVFFAAMIESKDAATAIAAFPKEPCDSVEFAWWGVPNDPCLLPPH